MNEQSVRLRRIDGDYHLHSYTDARLLQREGPLPIVKGDGIYVLDSEGRRYIEGMSGLWSVAVGFSEQRLVDVATAQLKALPYYHTFAGMTNPAVAELAEKLIAMCPFEMSKVFFTNSGSEANDTVIKMIWYRANSLGKPRKKKIISRVNGYHGVTAMSASLTGLPKNHIAFDLPFSIVSHAMTPHFRPEWGSTEEEFTKVCLRDLESLIQSEGADTIAAFVGEPVMGAGGVIPPPRDYWAGVQRILRAHDILLVADEVITGFGRTGDMFACETYGIFPDIMVLSKQLSSSYQPIAAVLLSEQIYQPIADKSAEIGVFGHGFTGGGNPVAAAVALENIRIIEERALVGNVRKLAPRFKAHLEALLPHQTIREVRTSGLLGAFEFNAASNRPPGTRGAEFRTALLEKGLITRNIGDTIALCPPLIITEDELDQIFQLIRQTLDEYSA